MSNSANASASSKPQRPPFTIEVAQTQEQIQACMDVRVEVFVVEQGFDLDAETDEYDPISSSLLLTVPQPSPPPEATSSLNPSSSSTSTPSSAPDQTPSRKPVGVVRFTPSIGKISRLAVMKDYRQYGFGKELMQAVEQHARAHRPLDLGKSLLPQQEGRGEGAADRRRIRIKCHSQIYVVPFYERLGFRKEGDEFDEEGAPHQTMIKDVELDQA